IRDLIVTGVQTCALPILHAHRPHDGSGDAHPLRVSEDDGTMDLERALAIVEDVVSSAPAPVSVFVADGHGELVAAATMDGAAPRSEERRVGKGGRSRWWG